MNDTSISVQIIRVHVFFLFSETFFFIIQVKQNVDDECNNVCVLLKEFIKETRKEVF